MNLISNLISNFNSNTRVLRHLSRNFNCKSNMLLITIHDFLNQVMCENSIDQKEGACLDCDHDQDKESPGNC